MCDHCVKRERAYVAATPDVRDAADRIQAQQAREYMEYTFQGMLSGREPTDQDVRNLEEIQLRFGDDLDILLGIVPAPSVPDTLPPNWA